MPRKIYIPEQIINSLREAEVLLSQGSTAAEAARQLGITRTDLLPLEKRIRRYTDQSGQKAKRVGKRKFPS